MVEGERERYYRSMDADAFELVLRRQADKYISEKKLAKKGMQLRGKKRLIQLWSCC